MAKGSVRKKGKKWYYRFYIEDESGNRVQKEFPGTESKSETEALLRKAMEDYEEKKFVAKTENVTVGMLLDQWVEEELKPGNLSNGTVMAYAVCCGGCLETFWSGLCCFSACRMRACALCRPKRA